MRFCASRPGKTHSGNSIGLPAREKQGVAMGKCRFPWARSTNTELAEAGLHECIKPLARTRAYLIQISLRSGIFKPLA